MVDHTRCMGRKRIDTEKRLVTTYLVAYGFRCMVVPSHVPRIGPGVFSCVGTRKGLAVKQLVNEVKEVDEQDRGSTTMPYDTGRET